jgi:hypothetical protein
VKEANSYVLHLLEKKKEQDTKRKKHMEIEAKILKQAGKRTFDICALAAKRCGPRTENDSGVMDDSMSIGFEGSKNDSGATDDSIQSSKGILDMLLFSVDDLAIVHEMLVQIDIDLYRTNLI